MQTNSHRTQNQRSPRKPPARNSQPSTNICIQATIPAPPHELLCPCSSRHRPDASHCFSRPPEQGQDQGRLPRRRPLPARLRPGLHPAQLLDRLRLPPRRRRERLPPRIRRTLASLAAAGPASLLIYFIAPRARKFAQLHHSRPPRSPLQPDRPRPRRTSLSSSPTPPSPATSSSAAATSSTSSSPTPSGAYRSDAIHPRRLRHRLHRHRRHELRSPIWMSP